MAYAYTQVAIADAESCGWNRSNVVNPMDTGPANFAMVMLDTGFWKALGIARKWGTAVENPEFGAVYTYYSGNPPLYYQHLLLDYLNDHKSYEDFFKYVYEN